MAEDNPSVPRPEDKPAEAFTTEAKETSLVPTREENSSQESEGIIEKFKDVLTPISILIAGVMISGSLLISGGSSVPSSGSLAANVGEGVPSQAMDSEDHDGGNDNRGGNLSELLRVSDDDYIRGNPAAPITIMEFSDFECPFCGRFHPTVQQALSEYEGQVRWVYRHFPLAQIHPNATVASEAAECAGEQGGSDAFWAYADALFENQNRLGNVLYTELAQNLKLNVNQFNTCVQNRKYQDKVQADYQLGLNLGITGTPGSFINEVPVRGALPYAQVKAIIEAELAKQKQ